MREHTFERIMIMLASFKSPKYKVRVWNTESDFEQPYIMHSAISKLNRDSMEWWLVKPKRMWEREDVPSSQ